MKPKTPSIKVSETGQRSKDIQPARLVQNLKLTHRYKSIRQDLLDQLGRNLTTGQYYADLIEDYMDMWIEKYLAVLDIRERGIVVKYENGGGQSGLKKNDSVELKIKLNAQMLKILSELGIKPSQGGGEGDEQL